MIPIKSIAYMVEEVGVEPILHGRQWNPVECHSNKINNLAISPSMYIHPGFRKVGLKVGTTLAVSAAGN